MKVSLNWLNEYVAIGNAPKQFAQKLTMAGFEVEKIKRVSGDTVFELEITPNRPDCLSMTGLAREAAAILNKTWRLPKITKRFRPKARCDVQVADKKGCRRYIATLIEGVALRKMQAEIKQHFAALGMRCVNSIVDITNFCLLETGQPLHAFDYDKLVGGKVVVRRARQDEAIITIDGAQRVLDPSVLVIADAKGPVAIAGIMGGKETEITGATKNILLESAYFDPILIRRTSRKLGLKSDSSYRFERGVDYDTVELGADRAVDLILKNAGGKIVKRTDVVADAGAPRKERIKISCGQINALLGTDLSISGCANILKKLDFRVARDKQDILTVSPPQFRIDIKGPVDIIEEISRIVGYDRIPLSLPETKGVPAIFGERRARLRFIHGLFLAQGLTEVITYAMISRSDLQRSFMADAAVLEIANPLTRDQEIMRPSMLPGLLSAARNNINRGQKALRFFELGKIYSADGEKDTIGIIMTGSRVDDWRLEKKQDIDFYDVKGVLEQALARLGICKEKVVFEPGREAFLVSGGAAAIFVDSQPVGIVGEIAEGVLSAWGIKQKNVFFAQMEAHGMIRQKDVIRKCKPFSEFPAISRDVSMAVKINLTAAAIEKVMRAAARDESDVVLSDVKFIEKYEGDKIAKGCRGLVFSLTYRSRLAKTLRDEEVARVHDKVCTALGEKLEVVIR